MVLTAPIRLPKDAGQKAILARQLFAQIKAGTSATLSGGATLRIAAFDPATIEAANDKGREELRNVIDTVTSTTNRKAVLYGAPNGGMLVLVTQSAVENDVLNQIFLTLDDSAGRQFTRNRGTLFWVGLEGIDGHELQSLYEQDSLPGEQATSLRLGFSNFLHRAPSHVVGVVFGSRSSLTPTVAGSPDYGGA